MPSHADLVSRYKELRAKARPISNALAKSLGKDVIGDVARKLGMLNGKEILLETEDEIVVLMDTGIFDIRRDGENAVEQFLRERPPAEGTDERLILETGGRPGARFSRCRAPIAASASSSWTSFVMRSGSFGTSDSATPRSPAR